MDLVTLIVIFIIALAVCVVCRFCKSIVRFFLSAAIVLAGLAGYILLFPTATFPAYITEIILTNTRIDLQDSYKSGDVMLDYVHDIDKDELKDSTTPAQFEAFANDASTWLLNRVYALASARSDNEQDVTLNCIDACFNFEYMSDGRFHITVIKR